MIEFLRDTLRNRKFRFLIQTFSFPQIFCGFFVPPFLYIGFRLRCTYSLMADADGFPILYQSNLIRGDDSFISPICWTSIDESRKQVRPRRNHLSVCCSFLIPMLAAKIGVWGALQVLKKECYFGTSVVETLRNILTVLATTGDDVAQGSI